MRLTIRRDLRPLDPFLGWSLVVGVVGLLLAAAFFPFGAMPPLCAFLLLTDLPCLTCGMTRSWVALVHGDLGGALLWNPAGAALCVGALLGALYILVRQLGAPGLRLESTLGERRGLRFGLMLAVALNWAYVVQAGKV